IALTTTGAFVCMFAFLPGGPLFDSTFLRVAFTVLAGIVLATTPTAGFFAVRILCDAAAPTLEKMKALLVATSAVALTVVMMSFWFPLSWRSSDGGIDGLEKRVHDAGIFVQSTLVVYETATTNGRTALINDPAVDFLIPSTREAWWKEPKSGIPLNRL